MADFTQELFTEKFRPKTLDKVILPDRIRKDLSKGLTQNTLLYSTTPGSGKTTIARILTAPYDTLRLNGSSENGIDIIRNKVVDFASTISLTNGVENIKVVYIDEADGLSPQAWDALRETIEHYADSVRFVCTCNKIDKIPDPIRSRFNCIPLYPINKEEETNTFNAYFAYVDKILSALGIAHDAETLAEFVRTSFPDMRTILNTIQALYTQGATELDRNNIIKTFDCSDLFQIIVNGGDPVENYKFVMENYATSPDEALLEISKSFIEFIRINYPQHNAKIPYLIITIAEYIVQMNSVPDVLVLLLACVFKLQGIIKG